MIGIQSQPQLQSSQTAPFREPHGGAKISFKSSEIDNDDFSKEDIEAERDAKVDDINKQKEDWDNLADELENSDNKFSKKLAKPIRWCASLLGLAATFVLAKYSSKLTLETLKSFTKTEGAKATIDSLKNAKEPIKNVIQSGKKIVNEAIQNPKVQECIKSLKDSKAGKAVAEFMKNEKVAKVLEPLKTTFESIKNIKIDGAKIQSGVENTMAATTTASVAVDNLTGRNNGKSNLDLATGV
jgi:cell fate (sporulation/competence/biofilm development) regulator YlbF (YheA/YmcA/DUF963 family)